LGIARSAIGPDRRESDDQRLRFRIGLGIEPLMRMAVTAKKVLQPKDSAVLGTADDHRSAGSLLQQPDATEDEGAHDPLPELRLRDATSGQRVFGSDNSFNARIGGPLSGRKPGNIC
jgi:hypothetical protein